MSTEIRGYRSRRKVCGDVERGVALVICDCGDLRQHDRPHAYTSPEHDVTERVCSCAAQYDMNGQYAGRYPSPYCELHSTTERHSEAP